MNSFYFDTSALIKRYLDETGSKWVRELFTALPGPLVLTSHLTAVESVCTLARRHRERPPLTFVCADARLLEIARAEGLLTENPNDHG